MYLKVVAVEFSSAFHGAAFAGMDTDVVVCLPDDQTKFRVSPTFAVNVDGTNDTPPALIVWFPDIDAGGGV